MARVAPDAVDPAEVASAAASAAAAQRFRDLTGAILADIDDERRSLPAADLDDLHGRLDAAWHAWQKGLGAAAMQ